MSCGTWWRDVNKKWQICINVHLMQCQSATKQQAKTTKYCSTYYTKITNTEQADQSVSKILNSKVCKLTHSNCVRKMLNPLNVLMWALGSVGIRDVNVIKSELLLRYNISVCEDLTRLQKVTSGKVLHIHYMKEVWVHAPSWSKRSDFNEIGGMFSSINTSSGSISTTHHARQTSAFSSWL